jgi:hypothetical protein
MKDLTVWRGLMEQIAGFILINADDFTFSFYTVLRIAYRCSVGNDCLKRSKRNRHKRRTDFRDGWNDCGGLPHHSPQYCAG